MKSPIVSPKNAIQELQKGNFVILIDNDKRENEGDIFIAAQKVTPEKINFMITHAKSFITAPMSKEWADRLSIRPMVPLKKNQESTRCNFGISVDAKNGITTGTSVHDKYVTMKILSDAKNSNLNLVRPGHIFPIIAHKDGLSKRQGHTEGSVELVRRAGFHPVACMCEVLNADGSMARKKDLILFAKKHNLKIVRIDDLKKFIQKNASQKISKILDNKKIEKITEAKLPTLFGMYRIAIFRSFPDNLDHAVIFMGNPKRMKSPLVRVHSECLTGDCLFSERCDCGRQLRSAMEKISKEKKGIILYLNEEGRGIGLANKIRAYALQDKGMDTVQANKKLGFRVDERDIWVASHILKYYSIHSIRLLTNNPNKILSLRRYGLHHILRMPHETPVTFYNRKYLKTKKKKMGHLLTKV